MTIRGTRSRKQAVEKYVAARNFLGRPTLMHKVFVDNPAQGICGIDMSVWSRMYFDKPLDILFCKKCKKLEELGMSMPKKAQVIPLRKRA